MSDILQDINDRRLYTVAAAAEICEMAQGTIRNNIRRGRLQAQKDGNGWRIRGAALREWMTALRHNKRQGSFRRPDVKKIELPSGYCWECRFCGLTPKGRPICSALVDFYNGAASEHRCKGCSFIKREGED